MAQLNLGERAETLLRLLVSRFIDEGAPVGSRTLSNEPELNLSAATIRNVMADLEDLGLVQSPHTSSGRVPTALGYRLFIDSLLTVKPLLESKKTDIKIRLAKTKDAKELMTTASKLLSEVTQFAGIVFLPDSSTSKFRHIEFFSLSPRRILVILVTEDGYVHSRVIVDEREYSPTELNEAACLFNETYSGKLLCIVRETLLREINQDKQKINNLMQTAMTMAKGVLEADVGKQDDVVVSGEEKLLNVPDFAAVDKLRKILETFKKRQSLLNLFGQSIQARGVSIFIGTESGHNELEECSVVTAPYEVESHRTGAIGVIGPTRMPYDSVIPIVDITAIMLGNALSQLNQN